MSGIVAGALLMIGLAYFLFQRYASRKYKGTDIVAPQSPTSTPKSIGKSKDNRKSKFLSVFSKQTDGDQNSELGRNSQFTGLMSVISDKKKPASSFKNNENVYDSRMDNVSNFNPNRVTLKGPRELLVFEDYDAEMEDEMICTNGDIVWVEEEFDDGWGMGQNLTTGSSGIFPMAICDEIMSNGINRKSEKSVRASSLAPSTRGF